MTNAVPGWNRAHGDGQARVPDLDDPVLVAALEHFGGDITNCRLPDVDQCDEDLTKKLESARCTLNRGW